MGRACSPPIITGPVEDAHRDVRRSTTRLTRPMPMFAYESLGRVSIRTQVESVSSQVHSALVHVLPHMTRQLLYKPSDKNPCQFIHWDAQYTRVLTIDYIIGSISNIHIRHGFDGIVIGVIKLVQFAWQQDSTYHATRKGKYSSLERFIINKTKQNNLSPYLMCPWFKSTLT